LDSDSGVGREHSSLAAPIDLVNMDIPRVYEIRVEGHLGDRWSDWFDGLAIRNDPNGETRLTGLISDQAALYGVLAKIHDLNLVLVSVVRRSCGENKMEN
jgi:hypothetical protein